MSIELMTIYNIIRYHTRETSQDTKQPHIFRREWQNTKHNIIFQERGMVSLKQFARKSISHIHRGTKTNTDTNGYRLLLVNSVIIRRQSSTWTH